MAATVSRAAIHARVRKASTRTSTAKAKDVRKGKRARVRTVNARKGF